MTWNLIEDLARDEFKNLNIKLRNTFSIKDLTFFSFQFTEFLKVFRCFVILSICLIIFKAIQSQDCYSNEITTLSFNLMPEIFRSRILILNKLNCTNNSVYLPDGYISKLISANECNFQLFNIQQIIINSIFSILTILIIFNFFYLNQLFLLINLKYCRSFILRRILPKNIDKRIIEILSNDINLFFTIYTMRIFKNKCYQKVIYRINRNTIDLNDFDIIKRSSIINI